MSTPPPAGPTPSPEVGTTALPTAGPSSPSSSAAPSPKPEQMDESSPAPGPSPVKAAAEDEDGEADLFGDEEDEDDEPKTVAPDEEEAEDKMDVEAGATSDDGREGSARPSQPSEGDDEDKPMFSDDDSITSSVRERRARLEYAEESDGEDAGLTERPRKEASQTSTTWDAHEGTDGSRWILRLPKHVHHAHMAYSRELYEEPDDPVLPELLEEDVQLDAKEIERRKAEELMRQVGSTIRWRWVKDADGVMRRQPNARVVKWSDGSLSLQLGKPTNLFSLIQHRDPSFPAAPQSYLVNHHWDAELMQTEGMFDGHMTMVPVGMDGEAHRVLAKGVKERNREKSRMKMWDEENMTAHNVDAPGAVKKPRARKARGGPREDSGAGSARKSAVRSAAAAGRGRRGSIYSDESDSEDDLEEERRRRRRLSGAGAAGGKGKVSAGGRDADEGGGYTNDGFVVDDDEEEESDSRSRSRSKSKSKRRASPTLSSSDEEEEEALESEGGSSSADERASPRKRAKKDKGGKSSRRAAREESIESEDMDSEDDDAGAGEIKKRRVVVDEDEEDE